MNMYAFFDSAKALYLSWRVILRIFIYLELSKGRQLKLLLTKVNRKVRQWRSDVRRRSYFRGYRLHERFLSVRLS